MHYTQSPDHIVHVATGRTLHEDAAALPTVVSDTDLNQVNWELMTILNKRGVAGKPFNPDDPTTYEQVYGCITDMIAEANNSRDYKESVLCVITNPAVPLTGIPTSAQCDNVPTAIITAGSRVLIAYPSAHNNNGIWVIGTGAWVRAADADQSIEVTAELSVNIEQGSVYASSTWTLATDGVVVPGATPMLFKRTSLIASLDFASSLGSNGYKKYPDPSSPTGYFIEQFGTVSVPSNVSDVTIYYPIVFPNVALSALATCDYTVGSGAVGYVAGGSVFNNGFTIRSSGNFSVRWRACGY